MLRDQIENFLTLEERVAPDHPYRKFEEVVDLAELARPLHALYNVCPSQGEVYADKVYCTSDAVQMIRAKSCHDATIKKRKMKGKNREKDRWLSGIRAPYERVFSRRSKRLRYKGLEKAQFQVGITAFVHNLKRLVCLQKEGSIQTL